MDKTVFNAEGYIDKTAHDAIHNVTSKKRPKVLVCGSQRDEDADKVIRTVKSILDLAGFKLLERIKQEDTQTGKKYL